MTLQKLNIWLPKPYAYYPDNEEVNVFQSHIQSISLDNNNKSIHFFHFPVLKISPVLIKDSDWQELDKAKPNTLCVFLSQNAVNSFVYQLKQSLGFDWLLDKRVICIGPTTHKALINNGINPELDDGSSYTSELLIYSDLFQERLSQTSDVLVFSGKGGRRLIIDYCELKNKFVKKLICYQRTKVPIKSLNMLEFMRLKKINAIFLTSCEMIDLVVLQLKNIKKNNGFMIKVVFCISQRVADYALSKGFINVVVAEKADSASLQDAAILWWKDNE